MHNAGVTIRDTGMVSLAEGELHIQTRHAMPAIRKRRKSSTKRVPAAVTICLARAVHFEKLINRGHCLGIRLNRYLQPSIL